MSTRNLDAMFRPASIALIGASKTPSSVGAVLARNLFKSDFDGLVMPVNPRRDAVQGVLTYPNVASLPRIPDLAVICTPAGTVPGLIAELGARGTRAAVVVAGGFGETGEEEGSKLQQAVLDAARPHLLRVLGPNSLGFIVPEIGLNASVSHLSPAKGDIAFVAQPGPMIGAVLDWAAARGIGFSHLVSLGNKSDVDFGDLLDYLGLDSGVRAILLYVQDVTDARKFLSAARAAARDKPVIVIRGGRYGGPRTGTSDEVYDTAFRRAGLLRVRELDELFDAVETLGAAVPISGDKLAVLTNGGGFEVLAVDALLGRGGRLAELAPETAGKLQAAPWPCRSCSNPVVLSPAAPPERYAEAIQVLLEAPGVDAVVVVHSPTPITSSTEIARAVIDAAAGRRRAVLTSWVGELAVAEARRLFAFHRVPTYPTPDQASRAFMHMVQYRRNQELLRQTPPSLSEEFTTETDQARRVVEAALARGRSWLDGSEVKTLFACYGLQVADLQPAGAGEDEAGRPEAIRPLGSSSGSQPGPLGPGALLSPPPVRDAAAETGPAGFSAFPACRPGAYELFVGMAEDPLFGPVLLFGRGGPGFDAAGDIEIALPPINVKLAREWMERTRVFREMSGYRGEPGLDLQAATLALLKVSQLVTEVAEVAEVQVNPLLVDPDGVRVIGARVRVAKPQRSGSGRLAIRPYPKELEQTVTLDSGQQLLLRPVRPEDEPMFQAGFARLTPEEVRMRFFIRMKGLSHPMAARLTQVDYDRETALVLIDPHAPEGEQINGVVRLIADPDRERGEFAVLVPGPMAGKGLGKLLIRRILDHAKSRGIREVHGIVLRENKRMLAVSRSLGFSEEADPRDYGVVRVVKKL